jgi:hypothetical protein
MHLSLGELEQNMVKTLYTMSTNWSPFHMGTLIAMMVQRGERYYIFT